MNVDIVEIFKDKRGDYRWRRLDGDNHKVIATCGQGYSNKWHTIVMAEKVNREPYSLRK